MTHELRTTPPEPQISADPAGFAVNDDEVYIRNGHTWLHLRLQGPVLEIRDVPDVPAGLTPAGSVTVRLSGTFHVEQVTTSMEPGDEDQGDRYDHDPSRGTLITPGGTVDLTDLFSQIQVPISAAWLVGTQLARAEGRPYASPGEGYLSDVTAGYAGHLDIGGHDLFDLWPDDEPLTVFLGFGGGCSLTPDEIGQAADLL